MEEERRAPGLALGALGVLLAAVIVAVLIWTRRSEGPDRISRRVFERSGYVVADGGCLDDLTAESINHFFAGRVGPVIGVDAPNVFSLGDDRYVWMFQDPYLDYTGGAVSVDDAVYVHNVAFVQQGACFDVLHRGSTGEPVAFQPDRTDGSEHFFWPLGGGLGRGGRLFVFWSEMEYLGKTSVADGLPWKPVAVWLASYDARSLERLGFAPAPNRDVRPQYGTAVETAGAYSYLFGNSNMLDLAVEGGYGPGPFSGTREYLARVPAGAFDSRPEYFAGGGRWTTDPHAAASVSARYRVSNDLQPRRFDADWWSVLKQDEFWGRNLVVDVAAAPWGPWTTVYDAEVDDAPPAGVSDRDPLVVYHPVLLPWRESDGDVIVVVSRNGLDPEHRDARLYRPAAFSVDIEQLRNDLENLQAASEHVVAGE